jgi:hypothetical protein
MLCVSLISVGCGGRASPPPLSTSSPTPPSGPPVDFAFETLEGKSIDSAATRGRAMAVLFVATYDLASQVMAQRLEAVLRVPSPRANGLLVVLEAPQYAQLAAAFRDSLGLTLPVAMADADTIAGRSFFGPVPRIPTLIVLDREGRELWRRPGVATHGDIEKSLATATGQAN